MRTKVFFILLLPFFLACSSGNMPEDILSRDKMMKVLKDIHMAEAIISNDRIPSNDSARIAFATLQKEVFKKHKTDSTQYAKSYQYYAKKPHDFKKMYTELHKEFHTLDSLIEEKKDTTIDLQKLKNELEKGKKSYKPKHIDIQKDIDKFNSKKRQHMRKELKQFKHKIDTNKAS